jgi:hypothetical protein
MTNTASYQQAAIENAIARQAEMIAKHGSKFFGHASGWVDTPKGELVVNFVVADGVQTYQPRHMRKTWTLGGKRVAAEKLYALLN